MSEGSIQDWEVRSAPGEGSTDGVTEDAMVCRAVSRHSRPGALIAIVHAPRTTWRSQPTPPEPTHLKRCPACPPGGARHPQCHGHDRHGVSMEVRYNCVMCT